jgi:hypothetical protein
LARLPLVLTKQRSTTKSESMLHQLAGRHIHGEAHANDSPYANHQRKHLHRRASGCCRNNRRFERQSIEQTIKSQPRITYPVGYDTPNLMQQLDLSPLCTHPPMSDQVPTMLLRREPTIRTTRASRTCTQALWCRQCVESNY